MSINTEHNAERKQTSCTKHDVSYKIVMQA